MGRGSGVGAPAKQLQGSEFKSPNCHKKKQKSF
jgi:hypothetical protein